MQNLFFHLQDAGRGSVISKISRLRGRYCPKRSKFQITQSAYPEHRFIGGAPNFPSPFFRKKPFWRTPQTSRLECAQRHVSVKVYFGRLPKQGSLRWDSLKNSRPFPISSFPQMFGFLPQTLRCVLSLRRGGGRSIAMRFSQIGRGTSSLENRANLGHEHICDKVPKAISGTRAVSRDLGRIIERLREFSIFGVFGRGAQGLRGGER